MCEVQRSTVKQRCWKLMCSTCLESMTEMAVGEYICHLFGHLLMGFAVKCVGQLLNGFILCSCVQIRNWFDYRNHICIVSILFIYNNFISPSSQIFWGLRLSSGFKWFNRYLRCLDQACMIFCGKIIIARSRSILSVSLGDNYWNVLHVCSFSSCLSFPNFLILM